VSLAHLETTTSKVKIEGGVTGPIERNRCTEPTLTGGRRASPPVKVGSVQRLRMSARAEVTYETMRHEVKEHFRERLHAYLCDPALDETASWARLRAVVTELGPADRGALAEAWYRSRHLPKGRPHVPVFVERTHAGSIL
jgi:hypothetical protein